MRESAFRGASSAGYARPVDSSHRDIQYATTTDGLKIAYWDIGSGIPIILIHSWSISHLELEWAVPSMASFYRALSAHYRVIKLDPRGHGLSDRAVFDRGLTDSGAQIGLTAEEAGLDIAAVTAACAVDAFVLMAIGSQGPAAIEFAARHPERLTGLILCDTVVSVASSYLGAALETLAAMSDIEAGSGVPVPVAMFDRAAPAVELEAWAALERANRPVGKSVTPTVRAMLEWDARPLAGTVETPTLILSSRNPQIDFLAEAQKLATGIPTAKLQRVDGTFAPYAADASQVLSAIADLLGAEPGATPAPPGFRTVVFTDVVGSTEFIERVGDDEGRRALRAVEQLVARVAADHGGNVVKQLGDGSLISFRSNANALAFAIALQRQSGAPLQLRVGMAAGEPIEEGDDIHGAVVALASRVADIGGAGEIVVTDSVHQLALGKGYAFARIGEVQLKGFSEPTTVWKVIP